jgi:hypothetical protein
MPGNKFLSFLYATTQIVKVSISFIVTLYFINEDVQSTRREIRKCPVGKKDYCSIISFYNLGEI